MKQKDFCHIRHLSDRQVLAYIHDDDEGYFITVIFKYDGAQASMKMTFTSEGKMNKALASFIKGELDDLIIKQIADIENNFKVEHE